MFSGSVRHNLDPFQQHSDEDLWQSLDQVGLKITITAMDGKLDTKVVDAGGNFSLVSDNLCRPGANCFSFFSLHSFFFCQRTDQLRLCARSS